MSESLVTPKIPRLTDTFRNRAEIALLIMRKYFQSPEGYIPGAYERAKESNRRHLTRQHALGMVARNGFEMSEDLEAWMHHTVTNMANRRTVDEVGLNMTEQQAALVLTLDIYERRLAYQRMAEPESGMDVLKDLVRKTREEIRELSDAEIRRNRGDNQHQLVSEEEKQ